MDFFTPTGKLDTIFFKCSRCGTPHVGIDKDDLGIIKVPPSITTNRKHNGEYYFCCVVCPRDIGRGEDNGKR